uniref:Uncharacterized protein n=1 Tax=Anguilla anguilla TaxID=7936 RepID=A0A0E9VLQ6_ANGAN
MWLLLAVKIILPSKFLGVSEKGHSLFRCLGTCDGLAVGSSFRLWSPFFFRYS